MVISNVQLHSLVSTAGVSYHNGYLALRLSRFGLDLFLRESGSIDRQFLVFAFYSPLLCIRLSLRIARSLVN